jgi:hypothetical protein
MFKFSLDKSSKKYVCPNCARKTFVRYLDNELNEYTKDSFGRCDRESKCGFHSNPDLKNTLVQVPNHCTYIKPKQSFINIEEVSKHGRNFKNNNFIQFLKNHFTVEEIKSIILKYLLGTSSYWKGATIFWQLNESNQVVGGKVMLYDILEGKRVKKPFNHINWMHKVLKIENYNLSQCLFGLHLINEFEGDTIAITESEKTAIMMSIFLPNYLWLATGSKMNFKRQLLEPIKKFKIIAFPDKSEYESWNKTCIDLNLNGFSIKCSTILELKNYPEGFDLADVFIENLKKSKASQTFNYNSKHNNEIKRLEKINPCLIDLIEMFELIY